MNGVCISVAHHMHVWCSTVEQVARDYTESEAVNANSERRRGRLSN